MVVVPALLLKMLSVDVARVDGLWIQVGIRAASLFDALLILIQNLVLLDVHLACQLS